MKKMFSTAWIVAAVIILASCSDSDNKNTTQAEAKPQVKIAQATSALIPQTETYRHCGKRREE